MSKSVAQAKVNSLLAAALDENFPVVWVELGTITEEARQAFLEKVLQLQLEHSEQFSMQALKAAQSYLEGVSNPILAVHAAVSYLLIGRK